VKLNIDTLSLRYPSRAAPVVKGVSLALAPGQIGVLVGPSGCGKTSLLRCVAGLEQPFDGVITLGEDVVSAPTVHVPPERRQVGMVFQDYALFPHLSVAKNIAFGIAHLGRAERDKRVAELLQLIGLPNSAERMPHQLSGGQQQRVALARALAPRPRVLLLDEPFSGLDVELRDKLATEVRAILKATGTTTLVVTHDQMEAFAIGDLIGVMNHGRLEQWADAYTLYHQPATRFVADFIGHGVFAPARLEQRQGEPVLATALGEFKLGAGDLTTEREAQGGGAAAPQAALDLFLRADDVVHDDDSPVKARIVRKAFRGSEFLYTLRAGAGAEDGQGTELLAHVPSHHDHAVGEWIGIRVEPDHLVTFERSE
jgi:iron(III) transport system ATP-binding protein